MSPWPQFFRKTSRMNEEAIAAGRAAFAAAATTIDRLEGFEIWYLERKVYENAPAPPSANA
jgi:hypothetical protein